MINVAVTGAEGFVGKRLMALSDKDMSFYSLSLKDLMHHKKQDVPEKTDHVIHLAAKTFVPDSWLNPREFYTVNVMGTQAVLDYCREHNCGLTYVSSYVYGVPNYLPINEAHPVQPNTPYNHSKLMGEELCHFYGKHFNVNTAIIRPFNLYGPGQKEIFLIPTIIKQMLGSDAVQLQTLSPKRDYLYIDDFVDLLLATIGFKGCDVFNAGFGQSYSVAEIAELLKEVSGRPQVQVNSAETLRNNEVMDVVANIEKCHRTFNWSPKTGLREGLANVVASGKNNINVS